MFYNQCKEKSLRDSEKLWKVWLCTYAHSSVDQWPLVFVLQRSDLVAKPSPHGRPSSRWCLIYLFIYIYIYIYTYIHIYVHIYIYTYIWKEREIYIHIDRYMYMWVYIYMWCVVFFVLPGAEAEARLCSLSRVLGITTWLAALSIPWIRRSSTRCEHTVWDSVYLY